MGCKIKGICWIISLQSCSIDLRMDPCRQRALASGPCKCRGTQIAADLHSALVTSVYVSVCVCVCVQFEPDCVLMPQML